MNIPKKDDPHHFHFMYVCKKQLEPVVDTTDLENLNKEEEHKKHWINDWLFIPINIYFLDNL